MLLVLGCYEATPRGRKETPASGTEKGRRQWCNTLGHDTAPYNATKWHAFGSEWAGAHGVTIGGTASWRWAKKEVYCNSEYASLEKLESTRAGLGVDPIERTCQETSRRSVDRAWALRRTQTQFKGHHGHDISWEGGLVFR